jgi:hypothetical protein
MCPEVHGGGGDDVTRPGCGDGDVPADPDHFVGDYSVAR